MKRPTAMTEVACVVRRVRADSIAVADGTMLKVVDERTGQQKLREQWFFLPRSQVTIEGLDDLDALEPGQPVVVHLPEWLARNRGLI